MIGKDGRFLKGHKQSKETKQLIRTNMIKSWKDRPDYHGMSGTKFHNTWRSIKLRCNATTGVNYYKYGKRDITYPDKWKSFHGFYEDMFESYIEGLTIDRIDNNKSYSKENCKWSNASQQANNKRNNVRLTYDGLTLTLRQWATKLNISYNSIKLRYYRRYLTGQISINQLINKEKA